LFAKPTPLNIKLSSDRFAMFNKKRDIPEIDRMGVLHDLADGRIKIAEASTLMGLGRRQVFRLAKAYGKHGPEALVSRRRGRPSNRCYPTALRTEVIGIIKDRYSDFGPTLAAEKLAELHGIDLARETLRQWMIMAGLWKDRRARLKPVHQPRHRRDCVGELIQIDGSEHWWSAMHPARLHRRCDQPADASAVCRERKHLRLFCSDTILS
jgi:hypothetical protein